MHSLISVIIPAKNRIDLLRQAARSAQLQPESKEIIIIDDGSYPALKQRLGQLGEKVKIIRLSSSTGPANARNTGLKYVKGQFIAFLDSDDQWNNNFLRTSLACLQIDQSASGTVCLSNKILPREWSMKEILRLHFMNSMKDVFRSLAYVFNQKRLPRSAPFLGQLSHMVFRRSAINGLRFDPRYKFCGDWKFILDCLGKGNIKIIPKRLITFRYNSGSYTATENKKNPLKKFKYYRKLLKEITKKWGETFFVKLFDFHIKHFLPSK